MMTAKMAFICVLCVAALSMGSVHASSCGSTYDRIFAECEQGACSNFLHVRDAAPHSGCNRRSVLIEPPAWVEEVFELELANNDFDAGTGVYRLVLEHNYPFEPKVFLSAREYKFFADLYANENRALGVVTHLPDDTLQGLKQDWGSEARSGLREMVFLKALDWLSFGIALLLLIYSILWFHKWQIGLISVRWAIASGVIQALMITLSLILLPAWFAPLVAMLGIFVPGLWLYQVVTLLSEWRAKRKRARVR